MTAQGSGTHFELVESGQDSDPGIFLLPVTRVSEWDNNIGEIWSRIDGLAKCNFKFKLRRLRGINWPHSDDCFDRNILCIRVLVGAQGVGICCV